MTAVERMSEADVLAEFRAAGALLEGHFLLSSGLHSSHYLQCARVMMQPARAERLLAALAVDVDPAGIDVVVSPAMGGVLVGYELARQIRRPSIFTERVEGTFTFRRGFDLEPGARVLIAEDVVTTGLSTRECIACCERHGGVVVRAACLVDRSGGKAKVGVPLHALVQLDLPVYRADDLPPELARIEAVKPGSRGQR